MRTLLVLVLLALSLGAQRENGFQTAVILNAGIHAEISGAYPHLPDRHAMPTKRRSCRHC